MRNKYFLVFIIIVFACFVFAQSEKKEKVLRVGIGSDVTVFDPWLTAFAAEIKVFCNIFEPLVVLDEESTNIKPHIATSWKVSNNNRIFLMKLREGIKFHDGTILTADDVVASASVFENFNAKVEKVDRFTIRFALEEPNSNFLYKLSNAKCGIAPSNTIRQYTLLLQEGRFDEFVPIGSGPFKFLSHERGRAIILESFADYWRGAPNITRIMYQIISDSKARVSALESGEVDLIDVILPKDLIRIEKNPELKIISRYGMNVCYLAMNITHKPLDNPKVRQALNLAINKLQIVRKFYYGGYGVPTIRVLSPAFWGFSALPNPGEYNPVKAKQMLAEAGHANGFSLRLICIPGARPYLPDPQGVAEEIKRQLAEVGVQIGEITIPANIREFFTITGEEDYGLVLSGWIDMTGDPDYTLSPLLSGKLPKYNFSQWSNQLFDEKLKAAQELPFNDIRGRIKLYNEAENIFKQEAPWVSLAHTKIFVVHKRNIEGIILYPNSMISYHRVQILQ